MFNALLISGTMIGIIAAIVLVLLVVIILGWYISTRNNFVKLRNTCEESDSTINVYLKKRYDLIPNLVETVKGYAKHESETLEKVIAARNSAMNAQGTAAKAEAENALSGTLKTLFSLTEAYPDLKANTNFIEIQNQLKQIEAELANARKYYNATVKQFNTRIEMFPASIVANKMQLKKFEYFEIEDEARQNVKVQF